MARGLNRVTLIGNLGDDPEVRYTQNDTCVATIRLATTAVWKDKHGDVQERTEWHRVVAFGKQAETIEEYSRKGDQLLIEGHLHYDKYTDKDDVVRYTCDVIVDNFMFLQSKKEGDSGSGRRGGREDRDSSRRSERREDKPRRESARKPDPDPLPQEQEGAEFQDDDIPF